jgi:hypothetical protein
VESIALFRDVRTSSRSVRDPCRRLHGPCRLGPSDPASR